MGRVAIFVDGGYLDYVLRDYGFPKVDYQKFAKLLAGDAEILRTYFYHCLPYQSPKPTPEEAARFGARQGFLNALSRLDRFDVRLGKLEYRGKDATSGKLIFEQKRVDILLAVDLVLLATKQRIETAVIVTGDSDFLPAINTAKNEGVSIHLFHGIGLNQPHRDLWEMADQRTTITKDLLKTVKR
jgi:uncharacterized LabA/DUF88 family protein